jgi:subtilisin family serine protease
LDPLFERLWGLPDIDAPEAWSSFTGNGSEIIVAVIDTGIDYNHEDLKEQMWWNPGEIPGNGVDDDGNGYVDDVHGANFVDNHGDPFDDNIHGTHCAGTIAGTGSNGIGVTGVSWTGVKLMALKFLDRSGSGRTSDAISAVDYAVAHGAKITSNSWGGGGSSSAMRVAIERAEVAGLLFIAAAGNSATNNDLRPQYPANYPVANVVSVASTKEDGQLSGFS